MLSLPNEAANFLLRYLLRRETFDRDEGLQLGLFTNLTIDVSTTLASLIEPTGIGYERKALSDIDWSVSGPSANHPVQTFVSGTGGWNGIVQGYFITTRAVGGTPRLVGLEIDGLQTLAANALARLGQTVTVVTPANHQLQTDGLVNIRGALQAEYNGIYPVIVTGSNSFTYTILGSPASPATGVITVNRSFRMDVGGTYRVIPTLQAAGG